VLRQQLRVLGRKTRRPRFTTLDRVLLAAASRAIPRDRWASSLVTPQTLLGWHRELVRRKWTYRKDRRPGRPPIDPELARLVLRMARENPRWGCVRIAGDLRKLGIWVGATTVRTLLPRQGLGPAPRRSGSTWTQFLRAQAEAIVAWTSSRWRRSGCRRCTCCCSSSSAPGASSSPGSRPTPAQRGSPSRPGTSRWTWTIRRGRSGSCCATTTPSSPVPSTRCSAPKARRPSQPRSGLRRPTPTPSGGCRACGRSVLTGRWCSAGRHLLGILRAYVGHYDQQRPHRGLALAVPDARDQDRGLTTVRARDVGCRDVLGGLIHEYHAVAA
jgi:putative transposase